MKSTIRDVARKANVSVSTVSRVINQKGYVHEDTKKVVMDTIESLGFVPNQLARSLTSRSSRIVGVIVPHIGHSFYGELLEGIEAQASTYGYKIMFCHTQDDPKREMEYLNFFEQYNIEGLIIASNFTNVSRLLELDIPIITVDHILDETIPSITSNNVKGGELAAKRLIDAGCKHILVFRGPSFLLTTQERTTGFTTMLDQHHLRAEMYDMDLINPDIFMINEIITTNPDVDGIFCFSDTLAFVVVNALKHRGIDIPKQIKVIGYDNTPHSRWMNPGITTIHQSINFMGKQSFILLHKLIRNGELETLHDIIDVYLVERETA
jgi:DNA-binding LacI/PurR family transcriptional regulator